MTLNVGNHLNMSGLISERPASNPERVGRFFFATDEAIMYRDNGVAWDIVSRATDPLTLVLDDLADVSAPAPSSNQVLAWDGAQWTAQDVPASVGPATVLYLDDTASGIGGYGSLMAAPAGGTENDDSVAVNSATSPVLIEGYVTPELNRTALEAGVWSFHTFVYVDNASGATTLLIQVYKRSSGGSEILLFGVTSPEINNLTVGEIDFVTVQPAFVVTETDHLVVKYYAQTTSGANRTVHLVHNGTEHYTHIETPLVGQHNDLQGRDDTGAHPASAISNTPAGGISAITVQGALNELDTDLTTHSGVLGEHLPIGAVIESASNPDSTRFAPLDGRWITRASCPSLSEILPAPQWDAQMLAGTAPASGLNKVQYIPETGLWFLMSSSASSSIYSSSDGVTWTTRTMPSSSAWSQIAYCSGLGLYLAVGTSPSYATSPDLVTWTARTFALAYTNPAVAASSSRFVMCSQTNLEAYYSTNGSSWTTVSFPISVNVGLIRYINNQFVFVAGSTTTTPIVTSPDGSIWTACSAVVSAAYATVGWNGSKYFLLPSTLTNTAACYTTTDFVTMTPFYIDIPITSVTPRTMEWQGSYFIMVTSACRMHSTDGYNWRRDVWPGGAASPVQARTNGAGRALAVLNSGTVYSYTTTNTSNLYLPVQLASSSQLKCYIRVDGPVDYVP